MKRILYLLPVLLMLMSACKKENKAPEITICPVAYTWDGEWQLYANRFSIGGPLLSWTPVTANVRINIQPDNLFSTTNGNQDRYLIEPRGTETILKVYKEGNTDTVAYFVKIVRDTLYLSNMGCIEGCSEKYVRPGTHGK